MPAPLPSLKIGARFFKLCASKRHGGDCKLKARMQRCGLALPVPGRGGGHGADHSCQSFLQRKTSNCFQQRWRSPSSHCALGLLRSLAITHQPPGGRQQTAPAPAFAQCWGCNCFGCSPVGAGDSCGRSPAFPFPGTRRCRGELSPQLSENKTFLFLAQVRDSANHLA